MSRRSGVGHYNRRRRPHAPITSPPVPVSQGLCDHLVADFGRSGRRGFRQASAPKSSGEITVERLNVVDADGTLRMVLAGKDRMHPGVMDGVTIERPRPVAGMLFFNDEGDEVGGLTYTGRVTEGRGRANAGLMFDQLKQDQTIGISYSEANGQRSAGFQVWDRSDTVRLSELIRKLNAANKLPAGAQRDAAVNDIRVDCAARTQAGLRRKDPGQGGDDGAGGWKREAAADADGRRRRKSPD